MLCISDTTDKVAKLPDVSADDQRLLKKLKTDMVSTQAIRMLVTVFFCRPPPSTSIVPATEEESTWVVETGIPV